MQLWLAVALPWYRKVQLCLLYPFGMGVGCSINSVLIKCFATLGLEVETEHWQGQEVTSAVMQVQNTTQILCFVAVFQLHGDP